VHFLCEIMAVQVYVRVCGAGRKAGGTPQGDSAQADVQSYEAASQGNGSLRHAGARRNQAQAQQLQTVLQDVVQFCVGPAVVVVCDCQADQR
jgi:hypothetical protein